MKKRKKEMRTSQLKRLKRRAKERVMEILKSLTLTPTKMKTSVTLMSSLSH